MLVKFRRDVLGAIAKLRGAQVRMLPYPGKGCSSVRTSALQLMPAAPPSIAELIKVLHVVYGPVPPRAAQSRSLSQFKELCSAHWQAIWQKPK